jgi:hypothetical protein
MSFEDVKRPRRASLFGSLFMRPVSRKEEKVEEWHYPKPAVDEPAVDPYLMSNKHGAKTILTNASEDGFPVTARAHGSDIVTVLVGSGEKSHKFAIHKSLLCQASLYFQRALTGKFKEAETGSLQLQEDCPMAFEVLYQWLYSGKIMSAKFYTEDRIADDVLWLRVHKLADARMVDRLQDAAYERLQGIFHNQSCIVPSQGFVAELFDGNDTLPHFKKYIVAHTAYWIYNDGQSGRWKEWEAILNCREGFGVAVAVQLTKISSTAFEGTRSHPASDVEFRYCHPKNRRSCVSSFHLDAH